MRKMIQEVFLSQASSMFKEWIPVYWISATDVPSKRILEGCLGGLAVKHPTLDFG